MVLINIYRLPSSFLLFVIFQINIFYSLSVKQKTIKRKNVLVKVFLKCLNNNKVNKWCDMWTILSRKLYFHWILILFSCSVFISNHRNWWESDWWAFSKSKDNKQREKKENWLSFIQFSISIEMTCCKI